MKYQAFLPHLGSVGGSWGGWWWFRCVVGVFVRGGCGCDVVVVVGFCGGVLGWVGRWWWCSGVVVMEVGG